MRLQKTEGIILKTSSFEDLSHILHVFSKEFGIISLVTKGHFAKLQRSYSPLLKIEAQVLQSEKDLWKCKELSIASSYPGLRFSLEKLKLSAALLTLVSGTLPPKAPMEALYTLLDDHLGSISSGGKPYTKASSFLLKFFYLEGSLPPISTHSEQENELLQKIFQNHVTELDDLDCPEELFQRIHAHVAPLTVKRRLL